VEEPSVVGSDKIVELLGVVVRSQQNDAGSLAWNLQREYFSSQSRAGSLAVECIHIRGATGAREFGEDVILQPGRSLANPKDAVQNPPAWQHLQMPAFRRNHPPSRERGCPRPASAAAPSRRLEQPEPGPHRSAHRWTCSQPAHDQQRCTDYLRPPSHRAIFSLGFPAARQPAADSSFAPPTAETAIPTNRVRSSEP